MIHILLMILKIIGIIILVLIGLILSLLFIVLLVPLRYRVQIKHGDQLMLNGTASWLLHFLHARITYIDSKLQICVRAFGFIIYDNQKQDRAISRKQKYRKSKKRKKNPRTESQRTNKKLDGSTEATEEIIKIEKINATEEIDEIIQIEKIDQYNTVKSVKTDKMVIRKEIGEDKDQEETKKLSFIEKILERMRSIKEKIISFIKRVKERIKTWYYATINIKRKINLILEFLKDEDNKAGLQVTFHSLKKLLKHILPTKVKSNFIFGTGDPCSTGQALGLMGILFCIYGDNIQITPDFENKRFEGQHDIRGRIRAISILIIIIKLILDKHFKNLKSNVNILKEAL